MPHVSVIIPAWNAAGFIRAALDSVLAQQFDDVEIIVVNDGSPDSVALEQALAPYRGDPRLRYLVQANQGPGGARNTGVVEAAGQFMAFLDADDWWAPSYLARQLEHVAANPELDLVYCDAWLAGSSPLAGRTYMETTPSEGPATLESLIALRCNVPTTCTLARREAIIRAGLFDPQLRRCEDFDLWLRMSAGGSRFGYHRSVLAHHRFHGASAAADCVAMFESQLIVYRKLAALLGPSHPAGPAVALQIHRAEADLALERGKQLLVSGKYPEAADALNAARRFYRSRKLAVAALGLRAAPSLVRKLYVHRYPLAANR
jgi:glycosyltransferase involved in cell wall biosynthesis